MSGRHELKYFISPADCIELRSRLRVIARPDKHASDNGGYRVRSLYFDNYSDKTVIEKLSGQSKREKFRLRFYESDTSLVRLEKKSKSNRLVYKKITSIDETLCKSLLSGDYNCLNSPNDSVMMELYSRIRSENLRPKCIVDYHREVYVYPPGNVRVCFDSRIRAANAVTNFFNQNLSLVPAADAIILEVKFDGFLPDVIKSFLQLNNRNQTEFSKYVAARMIF